VPGEFKVSTYGELLKEYELERGQPEYEPVRLGFGTVDAELRGISPGQIVLVAARTGVGKTWALETVEQNFAGRRDAGSLALSLEMPGLEWAERALAIFADVAPERVEQWARQGELIGEAAEFLERMSNALVVEQAVRLDELSAVFAQARRRLGVPLRLVLVDYVGLLGAVGRDAYERASAVGTGLKQIAKMEKVAIVVATQLSRAGGDGSEAVTLPMLRDSGVIEEAADFVLGAWRPDRARDLPPADALCLRDVLRVAILNNLKGPAGRWIDLRFRPDSRRLHEDADPFAEIA
jgi:replicative DNA helicase